MVIFIYARKNIHFYAWSHTGSVSNSKASLPSILPTWNPTNEDRQRRVTNCCLIRNTLSLRASLWTEVLPLPSRGRRRMSVKLTPQGPTTHDLWKGRQKWTAFVDDNACDPQGTCILFMEIIGPQNSKPRLASQQEEVIWTKYGDKKAHFLRGRTWQRTDQEDLAVTVWACG